MQNLITAKPGLFKSDTDGHFRRLGQLELTRPLRFPLDHYGPRKDLRPVRDVANLNVDKIASAQLTADHQVEHDQT